MNHILTVWIIASVSSWGAPTAMTMSSTEYRSLETCEAALKEIVEKVNESDGSHDKVRAKGICTRK